MCVPACACLGTATHPRTQRTRTDSPTHARTCERKHARTYKSMHTLYAYTKRSVNARTHERTGMHRQGCVGAWLCLGACVDAWRRRMHACVRVRMRHACDSLKKTRKLKAKGIIVLSQVSL